MTIISALPYTLQNGQTADANQVMANENQIVANTNTNAAHNGANSDITSLSGLSTPLSVPQGGTNLATLTAHNLLVGNGTGSPGFLAPGAANNLVQSNGTDFASVALAGINATGRAEAVNAQTGANYTVLTGDQGKLITFSNAGAIAVTLPQAGSAGFAAGWFADFDCLASSVGSATITPTTSTVDGQTTLILPPGTSVRLISDGANYQVFRAIGRIAQIVSTETGAVATGSTVLPYDDTIPQNTEGDQYMSLAITPTNPNSTLIIDVNAQASVIGATTISMALFQDATASALAAVAFDAAAGGAIYPIPLKHKIAGGLTAGTATTFKVRLGPAGAATVTFNGTAAARKFGGVIASSITITEILP